MIGSVRAMAAVAQVARLAGGMLLDRMPNQNAQIEQEQMGCNDRKNQNTGRLFP